MPYPYILTPAIIVFALFIIFFISVKISPEGVLLILRVMWLDFYLISFSIT